MLQFVLLYLNITNCKIKCIHRFIYHSEIDCGPNCAGNGIEFKTKTFFADEKHKAVNFLESRITYRYRDDYDEFFNQ